MQTLQNEDQYSEILKRLQDPDQDNECRVNDRVYRIKIGLLRFHERDQSMQHSYWRIVVPDHQEIKLELLKELHCAPRTVFRTSRIYKDVGVK